MSVCTKEEAFNILKPICDEIFVNPSKVMVETLACAVKHIHPDMLLEFRFYISVPLVQHLQQKVVKSDERILMLQVLSDLFKLGSIKDKKAFFNYFPIIIQQAYSFQTSSISNVCEELKLSVVQSLKALIENISSELLAEFYCKKNAPMLSFGVYLCVQLAQKEKLKSLQITAIECVRTLARCNNKNDNISMRVQIADLFMLFLPGVISGLEDVILKEKQSYQVTVIALKTWGEMLTLIMDDELTPERISGTKVKDFAELRQKVFTATSPNVNLVNIDTKKSYQKEVAKVTVRKNELKTRTREWYKETAAKVQFLIKQLKCIQHHSNHNVRFELTKVCGQIIGKCSSTLQIVITDVVEILITLSEDDYDTVSQSAQEILDEFVRNNLNDGLSMVEMVQDNFYELLISFPRIFTSSDENQQQSAMRLLTGYIKIYSSSDFSSIIYSCSHLDRLLQTLIFISDLDLSEVSLLEQSNIVSLNEVYNPDSLPWKHFLLLRNSEILQKFMLILHILGGNSASLQAVFDYFINKYTEDFEHQNQIVVIINEIMSVPFENNKTPIFNEKSSINTPQNERLTEKNVESNNTIGTGNDLDCEDLSTYLEKQLELNNDLLDTDLTVKSLECTNLNSQSNNKITEIDDLMEEPSMLLSDSTKTTIMIKPTDELIQQKLILSSNILELFLDPDNWYLPLKEDNDQLNLSLVKSNIVQMCLLTEGIGKIALSLGLAFEKYLRRTLYFLIERAGSKQPLISSAGVKALQDVAEALRFSDVEELLKLNADYISHYIVVKLRRIKENPGVLDALMVIMQTCCMDLLPCLQDIVNDVLLQSFDTYKAANIIPFLQVFYAFVTCVRRWKLNEQLGISEQNNTGSKKLDRDEYRASLYIKQDLCHKLETLFLDKLNQQREKIEKTQQDMINDFLNENKEEIDESTLEQMHKEYMEETQKLPDNPFDTEIQTEEPKTQVPSEIALCVNVLKRCLNFLPSKDRNKKLLVLDTLTEGVYVIKEYEDELLPLVHLIWSPLVDRFKREQKDHLIVHRSILLLRALADTSGDFIRHRVSKEVLTPICEILTSSSNHSRLQDHGAAYRYTQEYKLQLAILNNLPLIISDIDVADDFIRQVSLAALPYLSNVQPIPLQEACLKYLKILLALECRIVQDELENWIKMYECNSEFASNVEKIKRMIA